MRKGTEMVAHMARLRSMREKVCADRDGLKEKVFLDDIKNG
jgi:hypothetical protein